MMPMRCFTCGKPLADKFPAFEERTRSGEPTAKILSTLGVDRYCCIRMFLSQVNLYEEIKHYPRF